MAQYDVYRNPGTSTSKRAPFLVEVQGNFCEILKTCVVIPLSIVGSFTPVSVVNPIVTFDETDFILSTAEITTVHRSRLSRPVGSLTNFSLEVTQAIDRLLM